MKTVICLLVVASTGCMHKSSQSFYQPTSQLTERMDALKKLRPPKQSEKQNTSLAATANASKLDSKTEVNAKNLLADASKAYYSGDVPRAYEKANTLWNYLTSQSSRIEDEDLRNSPFREAALIFSMVQLKTHEKHEAQGRLEKLIKLNPSWAPAYLALANDYLESESYKLAAMVANKGIDRSRDENAELLLLKARAQRAGGDVEGAKLSLKRARKLFPDQTELIFWEGIMDYDAGILTSACENFATAYAKSGSSYSAYNHGLCLSRSGDLEKAKSVLKSSLNEFPNDKSLRMLLGNVYRLSGEFMSARKIWGEYLSMATSSDPVRLEVEAAMEELGNAKDVSLEALDIR